MSRAPLRQKAAVLAPSSLPDELVDELWVHYDRARLGVSKGPGPWNRFPSESLRQLAAYFHEYDTTGPDELIWRAPHGRKVSTASRQLTVQTKLPCGQFRVDLRNLEMFVW